MLVIAIVTAWRTQVCARSPQQASFLRLLKAVALTEPKTLENARTQKCDVKVIVGVLAKVS